MSFTQEEQNTPARAEDEIKDGERFAFGKNWQIFLKALNEERILAATESLKTLLGLNDLTGKRFLDIGSGSGLFSLAAHRLGAEVLSFDFDPSSVACTKALKERYAAGSDRWYIAQGSILDSNFLDKTVKQHAPFDIIYSWGVLHHTGNMWQAVKNSANLCKKGSLLALALYNDQGPASEIWRRIKKLYCKGPGPLKMIILIMSFIWIWGPICILDLFKLSPFKRWLKYQEERGMNPWRDVVDWVGGYPFEVATPDKVFSFLKEENFKLCHLKTVRCNHGCCEYL